METDEDKVDGSGSFICSKSLVFQEIIKIVREGNFLAGGSRLPGTGVSCDSGL
ncbi:hypothetical protein SLEP1_g41628 [Rubroshorea leprosula]|uniref:Uncharacterized protein n=1 Tax=Rubroshorea leprosula TaxID=152421 RepID=A0AAV5L776_9ROSI|nr:hypothetical protein SLEP1_g41628 [Rubroshorea leprosula]